MRVGGKSRGGKGEWRGEKGGEDGGVKGRKGREGRKGGEGGRGEKGREVSEGKKKRAGTPGGASAIFILVFVFILKGCLKKS
jgi:hypothetical protein